MISIGIALPVYNGANYIQDALDSILRQSYDNFTVFVSDNCSTDDTPHILSKYALKDKRIRVFRSNAFLPQQSNTNRAIELCESTWVKLFCHDDLMQSDCLATIAETIQNCATERVGLIGDAPGWQFANGYRYSAYQDDQTPARLWDGRQWIKASLSGQGAVPLPAVTTATIRREAYLASPRFDTRFKHFDTFLWYRLLMQWDYVFIPRFLSVIRIHDAQVHVEVIRTLRTVQDNRLYWPEFLHDFAEELALDKLTRMKTRMKGISTAGSLMGIQLLKGNPLRAIQIMLRSPVHWWPLLPGFAVRAYQYQARQVRPIADHVPLDHIYPE